MSNFIKYKEAIQKQRDDAVKAAKEEKNVEARFDKIYHIEKLYSSMFGFVADFVYKHDIELSEDSEPNC